MERLAEVINFKVKVVLESLEGMKNRIKEESQKLEKEFSKNNLSNDKIRLIVKYILK